MLDKDEFCDIAGRVCTDQPTVACTANGCDIFRYKRKRNVDEKDEEEKSKA